MTLTQWLEQWPYIGREHGPFIIVPDSTLKGEAYRAQAWGLSDVLVWKVSGGSIWFTARR